ncbi:CpsD/CapB family tyrosine-protein kinase [Sphingomonas sp. KR1UV-12]|uniref:CpsD/CapB family tyrosine-protein kinase n=1 Tax=Sphingomonas aurea TaxID=3063994 RepID=A0ABT9EJM8_9SPHN|nr:CpsD/CapB family tyrosine-protein kinase [Sphingomonas sp. KR1UV-12]MDP1027141.1 CpsD/CapB family tyrosine-protein kinase [Sphingomonas sp. KR1UV-12]
MTISTTPRHFIATDALGEAIVGFRSRDERSRSFNLLRTQIVRLMGNGVRVIGITSATPKVGKTFVACNLAASLARLPEMQTVLMDLDLRRGSVAERYNIPVQTGLTEYLAGRTDDLADLAWGVEGQQLTIYPCAVRRVMSSELLASARFQELIVAARALPGQAVVLLDLPPVFANDDAMIVGELIDGYILVVEDGVTTAKQVRDSMRLMKSVTCFGTVLNNYVRGFAGGDYGYGYGKSSGYADYYN